MEPRGLDGTRIVNNRVMGRISHISGYRVPDERAKSQATLTTWRENWTKENPNLPENFHSLRGTMLHAAIEHYLKTQSEPELHDWIKPFWPQAKVVLRQYSTTYWCEGPFPGSIDWPANLTYEADGEIRYHVWHDLGVCGTPDWVGRWRGQIVLADWKTSTQLYLKAKPSFKPAKTSEGEEIRRQKINGWYKCQRTFRQLAAYTEAIEQRLGRPGLIQGAVINVLLEDNVQQIYLNRAQLKPYWEEFQDNLEKWKQEHALI
jgi:hypothetical protein